MAIAQMPPDCGSCLVDSKLHIAAFVKTTAYEAASSVGRRIFRRRPRDRRRRSVFDGSSRHLRSVLKESGIERSVAGMSVSDSSYGDVSTYIELSTKMFTTNSKTPSGGWMPCMSHCTRMAQDNAARNVGMSCPLSASKQSNTNSGMVVVTANT